MPRQQTLKFTIRQDGQVTEEVTGTTSHECVEITRAIAKAVVLDEGTTYDYACWRSEDQVSTEILVMCNKNGIMKVCGITDTAGNWIYKDF